MASLTIPKITGRLRLQEPASGGLRLAAVSVIFRDGRMPSTLMIERARRAGDPWSGQIAFPGGKMQAGDGTVRDTAIRETLEEVGIDLGKSADFLGYAEAMTTHTGSMDVVPSAFLLRHEVKVRPNGEVASHRWVDLGNLLAPRAKSSHPLSYAGRTIKMPAFVVGDYVIWGLTYRIVESLLGESRRASPAFLNPKVR